MVFTNAVEWAGHRLGMGEGATGSILAAVGTAMPETLIPIVAIIGGAEGAEDVAIGAIIGAPFLLATVAMAVVGISALIFRSRREQGLRARRRGRPLCTATSSSSSIFFAAGVALGVGLPDALRYPLAAVFVIAYGLYVRNTLRGGGEVQEAETIGPLYFDRTPGDDPPSADDRVPVPRRARRRSSAAPTSSSRSCSPSPRRSAIEPLVLSLILAPLATELPEKANSVFWIKDGKDSLALGNITGAMVFQSTIPIAVGLLLTEWDLDRFAIVSGILGLAGGVVAFWALRQRRRFELAPILAWSALFAAFLFYVLLS